jgi:hypothetical protein
MKTYIKSLLFVLLLLAFPAAGLAQNNLISTGTISTAGADCSTTTNCVILGVQDFPSIGLYLNVATSGTFVFEATTAANASTGTWFAINDDVAAAGTATADGYFTFSNPGYTFIRLRASAISGAATVAAVRGFTGLRSTATLSGSAQGDGALQDGANSAIEATVADLTNSNPLAAMIVDGSGNQITSFGGGTQYAVDAALGATPTGTLAVAIRDDSLSGLTPVEGDAIGLRVDANGALWVIPSGTTAVSGTVTVTDGAGALNVIVDSGSVAVTNAGTFATQIVQGGFTATVRDLANDALNVAIVDGSGAHITSFGGGTQFAEDVASADGNVGTLAIARRTATPANTSDTDGDYEVLQMAAGRLWTSTILTDGTDTALIDGSGNLAVTCSNCSGSGVSVNEDVASADAHPGTPAYSVRNNTLTGATTTDGDYQPLKSTAAGAMYIAPTFGDTVASTGTGASGAQTQRVVTATDSTIGTVTAVTTVSTVTNVATIGTSVTPGTAAANLGKAEDASHTSADTGVLALAVRRDTAASSTVTDGEYATFNLDSTGRLWSNSELPDAATIADNTATPTVPGVASFNMCYDAASSNWDFCRTALSTEGTHGTTLGTITSVVGGILMGNASTATPTDVGADGDAAAIWLTRNGAVNVADGGGTLTVDGTVTITDGAGAVNVICDSGCSGGSQYAHNLALTADSTNTTIAGFHAKDFDGSALPSAVGTEGDAVMGAASLSGVQYVMIVNEDGSLERGTSTTPMVVGDGSGALNVIVDSGAIVASNGGTFVVQENGAALTALQLIDDTIFADDAAFTAGTHKVQMSGFLADDTIGGTDSTNEDDAGAARMSIDRILFQRPGGSTVHYRTSAGATEDEHEVKATGGTLYSILVTNTNAAARYLRCYNLTAANTTPGTSTVFFGAAIPGNTAGAGFSIPFPSGLTFDTALTCALTTGAADNSVAEVAADEIKVIYTYR